MEKRDGYFIKLGPRGCIFYNFEFKLNVMAEFIVGDVVKLKSAGPDMTIAKINDSSLECTWFDQKGELKSENFIAEILEKEDNSGFASALQSFI